MKDVMTEFINYILIFIICPLLVVGTVICYHRLTILSHRIDMVIMVQQSQEIYIDKLMEKNNEKENR